MEKKHYIYVKLKKMEELIVLKFLIYQYMDSELKM